jgi:hypothetical protein
MHAHFRSQDNLCPVLLEDFTNTDTASLFGSGVAGEGGKFFREVDASGFGCVVSSFSVLFEGARRTTSARAPRTGTRTGTRRVRWRACVVRAVLLLLSLLSL